MKFIGTNGMIFQRLCVLSGKHASTRNDCLMDFKDYIIDVSASLASRQEFDIYPINGGQIWDTF
jgi:hypothetical protein